MKYKVVDLFAGVGGLSYGFAHDDDFEIVAANEILLPMATAYSLNHPSVKMYNKDIKEVIKDNNCIVCSGKCFNCSYCKNKKDLRKVKFVRHGKGYAKIEMQLKQVLTVKELNNLIGNKYIDYGLFLKQK